MKLLLIAFAVVAILFFAWCIMAVCFVVSQAEREEEILRDRLDGMK